MSGVKEASFLLNGVSLEQVADTIMGMHGWSVNYFIEERSGGKWILAFFKEVERQDNCFLIKVGLREGSRWKWGEVFRVQISPEEEGLRLVIRRVRGVGRVGSDLVGYWIVDNIRKLYADILLSESTVL